MIIGRTYEVLLFVCVRFFFLFFFGGGGGGGVVVVVVFCLFFSVFHQLCAYGLNLSTYGGSFA